MLLLKGKKKKWQYRNSQEPFYALNPYAVKGFLFSGTMLKRPGAALAIVLAQRPTRSNSKSAVYELLEKK